jgi:hypothetical protein
MRLIVGLSVLIALWASADAATVRRARHPAQHVRPEQPVGPPRGFAVPGWTDEETRQWIDSASGPKG